LRACVVRAERRRCLTITTPHSFRLLRMSLQDRLFALFAVIVE